MLPFSVPFLIPGAFEPAPATALSRISLPGVSAIAGVPGSGYLFAEAKRSDKRVLYRVRLKGGGREIVCADLGAYRLTGTDEKGNAALTAYSSLVAKNVGGRSRDLYATYETMGMDRGTLFASYRDSVLVTWPSGEPQRDAIARSEIRIEQAQTTGAASVSPDGRLAALAVGYAPCGKTDLVTVLLEKGSEFPRRLRVHTADGRSIQGYGYLQGIALLDRKTAAVLAFESYFRKSGRRASANLVDEVVSKTPAPQKQELWLLDLDSGLLTRRGAFYAWGPRALSVVDAKGTIVAISCRDEIVMVIIR